MATAGTKHAGHSDAWRNLRWGRVFTSQRPLLCTALFALVPLAILVVCSSSLVSTATRPYKLYDATIAYAYNAVNSVPGWASAVPGALALLLTLLALEVGGGASAARGAARLALTLHFFLDAGCAFLSTVALTDALKNYVGRLRPDFLARCQPAALVDAPLSEDALSAAPDGLACTNTDDGVVHEGRLSFPSGHSSAAAVWAAYVCVYGLWALFNLSRRRGGASGGRAASWRASFLSSASLYWLALNLGWAAYVGASRVHDNWHNVSDVCAGWILGGALGALFAGRATSTAGWVARDAGEDEESEQLPAYVGYGDAARVAGGGGGGAAAGAGGAWAPPRPSAVQVSMVDV